MDLVALVRSSDGTYPGHMVIGQESGGEMQFFGFHFDLDSIPEEYRSPDRWQEYLYSAKVPGNIEEETEFVRALRAALADRVIEKRVACDIPIATQIPASTTWRHFAHYSFQPDDFHSDTDPCYNCVTWATKVGNTLVPDFLKPVRQGRIKLIIRQLRDELKGEVDGETNPEAGV